MSAVHVIVDRRSEVVSAGPHLYPGLPCRFLCWRDGWYVWFYLIRITTLHLICKVSDSCWIPETCLDFLVVHWCRKHSTSGWLWSFQWAKHLLLLVALCTVYSIHLLAPARVLTHGRDAPCARRTGSKGLITKHKGTRVSLKWACPIEMHFVKASLEVSQSRMTIVSTMTRLTVECAQTWGRLWPSFLTDGAGYQVAASGGEPVRLEGLRWVHSKFPTRSLKQHDCFGQHHSYILRPLPDFYFRSGTAQGKTSANHTVIQAVMNILCHAMLYFCHASWLDSVLKTQHGNAICVFFVPFLSIVDALFLNGSPWTRTPDQHHFLPREALWAARQRLQADKQAVQRTLRRPCLPKIFGLDSWDCHFILGALTDWKFLRLLFPPQADVLVSQVGGCHCNLLVRVHLSTWQ